MKFVLTLLLILSVGMSFATNGIIAIVNGDVITYKSIEHLLDRANSFDEKLAIIDQQIDVSLQMAKFNDLNIEPSQQDINRVVEQVAKDNNITIEEFKSHPQYSSFVLQISNKLSLIGLQQIVTKDLTFELKEEEIYKNCTSIISNTAAKQIRIAQIIISKVEDSDTTKNQEQKIKNFLEKLSDHISKGASFDAFAKLHSQHPSYANGGLSDWLFVNSPTLELLNSLRDGEVSQIYNTDVGWAIAKKIDERYVNSDLEKCKEKIIYQKAQQFYSDWLKDLRDSAYIEIYTDKL